ncbi:MAG: hypothetical protein QMD07_01920, partial [Thermodesulfovibrionales bacterium]|nr:hypothetical protein [Thermodesulfovibrionales bacterium]
MKNKKQDKIFRLLSVLTLFAAAFISAIIAQISDAQQSTEGAAEKCCSCHCQRIRSAEARQTAKTGALSSLFCKISSGLYSQG